MKAEDIAKRFLAVPIERLVAPSEHDRRCIQLAKALLVALDALRDARYELNRLDCVGGMVDIDAALAEIRGGE